MQTILKRAKQEFYNRMFQTSMKTHGIHHFSTHGEEKAAVVERFNRTLKEKLYRYLTAKSTRAYLKVLQSIVKGCNATVHRSIGVVPKDVTEANEAQVWHRLYDKRFLAKKKNKQALLVKRTRVHLNKKCRRTISRRVFTRLDRIGFCEPPCRVNGSIHLQSTRMGWDSVGRCILPTRFATGDSTLSHREGKQVKVRWQRWCDKYYIWIEGKAIRKWKG